MRPSMHYIKTKLTDGSMTWELNGKFHRDNGPAIIYADVYKAWYKHGKCHREDGPAQIWDNGRKYWFLDDKQISQTEFNERMGKTTE